MTVVKIIEYQAGWDVNDHEGRINLRAEDGSWSDPIRVKDPNEFSAIVDLLRNEKPIFHNTQSNVITTLREPIGEGE